MVYGGSKAMNLYLDMNVYYRSYILEFENSKNPLTENKEDIKNVAEIICSDFIEWNEEIDRIANEIVAKSNSRIKDALHLACAVYGKCEYFITCDNRFIRTIKHNARGLKHVLGSIRIVNPVDFIGKEFDNGANE